MKPNRLTAFRWRTAGRCCRIALTALLCCAGACLPATAAPHVREPAVAGSFYPGDPARLRQAVAAYLEDALPGTGSRPIAIISPHAGYSFSAQICADAFNQAAGFQTDLVVVLGCNHTTAGFDAVSIYGGAGYRTPLGVVAVDTALAARLREADARFGYRAEVHRREHSIEVLLPFVQVLFPKARILPVIVGSADRELTQRLGAALARLLAGRDCLIAASTDLSHYPAFEEACSADRATLEAMAELSPERFAAQVEKTESRPAPGLVTAACGAAPVMAALSAARHMGARSGRIVSYANSGHALVGERDRVVGYGAAAFYAAPPQNPPPTEWMALPPSGNTAAPLTEPEQRTLLTLARCTLERYFETGTLPLPRPGGELRTPRGAFVTLKKAGALRGCIGHMRADLPLCQMVGRLALEAALRDRRFPPVTADELPSLAFEVSVLTPFERIDTPEAIRMGRDGVLLRKQGRSAVFLPQVAPEQGWNREEMLAHLCRKAGLPADAWRSGADLFTFQAEVFGEPAHR